MDFSAKAQKAAKLCGRIGDMAADLLDHEPLDGSDPFTIRIVNGGALDLVALDQRMGRTGCSSALRHG